jgi:hypothetical protein
MESVVGEFSEFIVRLLRAAPGRGRGETAPAGRTAWRATACAMDAAIPQSTIGFPDNPARKNQ